MADALHIRRTLAALIAVSLALTGVIASEAAAEASVARLVGSEFAASSGDDLVEVEVPAVTEAGDLLLAVVSVSRRSEVRGPDGWELIRSDSRSRELTQTVWVRRAGVDEPGSYTWDARSDYAKSGAILAFADAALGVLETTVSATESQRSRSLEIPSVEPGSSNALLVGLFSMVADGTFGVPESMDPLEGVQASNSLAVATEQLADAAPTGERVVTRAASGGAVGHLVAIESQHADHDHDHGDGDGDDGDHGDGDGDDGYHGDDDEGDHDNGSGDDSGHDDGDHTAPPTGSALRWHDASTWPSNEVPGASDDVVIDGYVVVAADAEARTITVTSGSTLEFAPGTSATLSASGNVLVEGTLRMEPANTEHEHLLRFVGIDEEAYVGGGHVVLDSDVGLWFTGHGRAVLEGSEQLAWSRAAGSLAKGADVLSLEEVPTGWRVGDEIVITPTSAPGTSGHSDGYSEGRIQSISGNTVQLDTPFAYDHPRIAGTWGAEVMNMTRNVRIEGQPEARAHVMFTHTHQSQHIRNVGLRHMGPRQDTDDDYRSGGRRITIQEEVMGRYPLHFHHNGAGSAGTLVENVVVQESGARAFVAHASDGITFRGTIAHDVYEEAYWWDTTTGCCGRNAVWEPGSNDVTYDRAIASLIKTDPPFRGYRLSGFELGHGSSMTVMNSVAVGVQGNRDAAGFNWPEGVNRDEDNHWKFEGNVSHNNKVSGIFVWQNTSDPKHHVEDSVLYHNGDHGINHGAYSNAYHYEGLTLYGNGHSGVFLHAQGPMRFTDMVFDGAGITQYAFRTTKHRSDDGPVVVRNGTFRGYTEAAISFRTGESTRIDIVDPTFEGPQSSWFELTDEVPADSEIRVQLSDGTAFRLHPASSSRGEAVAAWNARRERITAFD